MKDEIRDLNLKAGREQFVRNIDDLEKFILFCEKSDSNMQSIKEYIKKNDIVHLCELAISALQGGRTVSGTCEEWMPIVTTNDYIEQFGYKLSDYYSNRCFATIRAEPQTTWRKTISLTTKSDYKTVPEPEHDDHRPNPSSPT